MAGRRLAAPLSGAAFVALAGAAALVGDPNRFSPGIGPHQPDGMIALALVENRDAIRTSAYLTLGAAVFLLFFVGYLRDTLRRPDGDRGPLAAVAFGAGIVITSLHLVAASIAIAASELASGDAAVAKTLLIYGWDYHAVIAAPATAAVAATAIAAFGGAPLPRWFGWFSVTACAALIALLVGRTAGLGGFAFLVWALIASVAVGRSGGRMPGGA